MGGPIDPIEGVEPYRQPEQPPASQPSYRRTLHGVVTSVRSRNRHPHERHVLDATVGEQEHDEIVVRVSRGDVHDLSGKNVVITLEP